MLNIDEPAHMQPKLALFRLGFRPFFLFGSLFSIFALPLWILSLKGEIQFTPHGSSVWWHSHEMLFGFVAAIVVGFLLTAVQNWTGRPGLKGFSLMILFVVWLLPRILLLNQNWLPLSIVATLDLLFLPLAALVMAKAVVPIKQWRNFGFVPILLILTLTNACSYLGLWQQNTFLINLAFHTAVLVITVIVTMIGGRVIPFFTDKASNWQRQPAINLIEKLTFASLGSLIVAVILQQHELIRLMAAIAAVTIFCRWFRWGWQHTFKTPLLWSLHFSYLFIPIGLLIIAVGLPISSGIHAITVGGMGGMILAMMARVSLGHTGRQLQPPKAVVIGFGLMITAAACRTSANIIPQFYLSLIIAAATLWVIAFACFIICYGPMLCKPRVDGRPG
ncbi:MAG: NnrS family protein [Parashewanella sp.]